MKKTIFIVLLLVSTTALFAQEKKKTVPATPKTTLQRKEPKAASPSSPLHETAEPAPDPAMVAMMEYMKPSKYHKQLSLAAGEWKEEIEMWTSADAPVKRYSAMCVVSMILGDLYQETIHSGNFDGKEFYGRGIIGYDNAINKFVSTWIDNLGTGIMYTEGTYDAESGTTTFRGEVVDPVLKMKVRVREVMIPKSENMQVFEMYVTPPGKEEYKSMQITMTR